MNWMKFLRCFSKKRIVKKKNVGNHIASLEQKIDEANKIIEEKNIEIKKSKLDQ